MAIDGVVEEISASNLQGGLWLTQKGDPNMYLIQPGQDFIVNRKGKFAIVTL